MSRPNPTGRDPGRTSGRAPMIALCAGGLFLTIALVLAMGRWMIG